jgi:hypothetical protein
MKFDAARATEAFATLGGREFVGAAGEERVADFVAAQLEQNGWMVERAMVEGSRFPLRTAPWLGWLGYGALIAAAYLLLLNRNNRSGFLAVFILVTAHLWLTAVLRNHIRWGRRMPPLERAPLVLAQAPGSSAAPARVVFQAALGGLKPDHLHSLRLTRSRVMILNAGFLLTTGVTVVTRLLGRPVAPVVWLWLGSAFLVLIALAILGILYCEIRATRSVDGSIGADRRGLALLLELARGWPRSGSRPIEAIFVAAGGQRLDYAGAREVVRRFDSEWPRKPSLLLLFFAPGTGGGHRVVPIAWSSSGTRELAKKAASSLWIPIHNHDLWAHSLYWPLASKIEAMDVIALLGAHDGLDTDLSFSPQVLDHAAQLSTEIALRWAKLL